MNYIIFHRKSNNFTDILNDPVIKKSIELKMSFHCHLVLRLNSETNTSYMMIKYGDDAVEVSHIIPDRSPIPNKDYIPIRAKGPLRC